MRSLRKQIQIGTNHIYFLICYQCMCWWFFIFYLVKYVANETMQKDVGCYCFIHLKTLQTSWFSGS